MAWEPPLSPGTGSAGFGIPVVQRGCMCSCVHSPTAAVCIPGTGSTRNCEAAPKLNLLFYFPSRAQTGKIKKGRRRRRRGESAEHREPRDCSSAMELLCKAKRTTWEELSWSVEWEGIPVWWKGHIQVWRGQSRVPSSAPHKGVHARVVTVTVGVSQTRPPARIPAAWAAFGTAVSISWFKPCIFL